MKVAVVLAVLAIIGCTVADHHLDDCSGNIVDVLSECALSIQNGEPLTTQQQKCAPDSCHYDRPSADLINDLQNDLSDANTRIDTLQQFSTNLAANTSQSISVLTNSISTNADNINSLTDGLASNTDSINSISDSVSTNTDNINSNTDSINSLTDGLATNTDNINSISDSVSTNTDNINSNTDNINSNIDSINTLKGQVSDANDEIDMLKDLPTSCQDIKTNYPSSPSGVYLLNLDGEKMYMYCYMDRLCGSTEGWMRIGYLDMTNPAHECPDVLNLLKKDTVRCCARTSSGGSCPSISISSKGTSYSEVCGRVTGYQYASTDGIFSNVNIDGIYVDGISITYGSNPRKHIWTFIATIRESSNSCPCANGGSKPDFVGEDYFCESGNPTGGWSKTLYSDDRIWDGLLCRNNEASCCNDDRNPPWFYKQLDDSTTEDIELRVCGNQGIQDEDNPIEAYEIYIK